VSSGRGDNAGATPSSVSRLRSSCSAASHAPFTATAWLHAVPLVSAPNDLTLRQAGDFRIPPSL